MTQGKGRALIDLRKVLCVVAIVLMVGCSARGTLGPVILQPPSTVATDTRLFVATNRARIDTPDLFGSDRSLEATYGRLEVSIPLDRAAGTLTYPNPDHPDPAAFGVSQETIYANRATFRQDLNHDLGRNPAGKAVVVFVHGYNTNFAEGVYRFAQIKHDLGIAQTSVLYSFPSEGTASGYVYDLSSVLFARDGLEELLNTIAASDATDIIIVAHSMGAVLALESVRQAALRVRSPALGKLRGMFLISPDVGVDLFASQRQTIDPQTIPICVIASSRDWMLDMSARLHGGALRLGQLTNAASVALTTASVLDISQFTNRASGNHMTVAQSTQLIDLIRNNKTGQIAACATERAEGTVDHVAAN